MEAPVESIRRRLYSEEVYSAWLEAGNPDKCSMCPAMRPGDWDQGDKGWRGFCDNARCPECAKITRESRKTSHYSSAYLKHLAWVGDDPERDRCYGDGCITKRLDDYQKRGWHGFQEKSRCNACYFRERRETAAKKKEDSAASRKKDSTKPKVAMQKDIREPKVFAQSTILDMFKKTSKSEVPIKPKQPGSLTTSKAAADSETTQPKAPIDPMTIKNYRVHMLWVGNDEKKNKCYGDRCSHQRPKDYSKKGWLGFGLLSRCRTCQP